MEVRSETRKVLDAREDHLVEAMQSYMRGSRFRYELLLDYISPNSSDNSYRKEFETKKGQYFKKFPEAERAYTDIVNTLRDIDKDFLKLLFRRANASLATLPTDFMVERLIPYLSRGDIEIVHNNVKPTIPAFFQALQTSRITECAENFDIMAKELLQRINEILKAKTKAEDRQAFLESIYDRLKYTLILEPEEWQGDQRLNALINHLLNPLLEPSLHRNYESYDAEANYRMVLRIINEMRKNEVPQFIQEVNLTREKNKVSNCAEANKMCKILSIIFLFGTSLTAGVAGIYLGVTKKSEGYVDPDLAAGAGSALAFLALLGFIFWLVQMRTGCAPSFAEMRSSVARALFFRRAENSRELQSLVLDEDKLERGEAQAKDKNGNPTNGR